MLVKAKLQASKQEAKLSTLYVRNTVGGRGCAPEPVGELTVLSQTPSAAQAAPQDLHSSLSALQASSFGHLGLATSDLPPRAE